MRNTIQRKDVTTAPALASPSNNNSMYLTIFCNAKNNSIATYVSQVPTADHHSLLEYQMGQGPLQLPCGPGPARNLFVK